MSRLQRFDFKRIGPAAIRERLKSVLAAEGLRADDAALVLISRHADGGMRDALSILDQCLSFRRFPGHHGAGPRSAGHRRRRAVCRRAHAGGRLESRGCVSPGGSPGRRRVRSHGIRRGAGGGAPRAARDAARRHSRRSDRADAADDRRGAHEAHSRRRRADAPASHRNRSCGAAKRESAAGAGDAAAPVGRDGSDGRSGNGLEGGGAEGRRGGGAEGRNAEFGAFKPGRRRPEDRSASPPLRPSASRSCGVFSLGNPGALAPKSSRPVARRADSSPRRSPRARW
jgi:hypothetical protein